MSKDESSINEMRLSDPKETTWGKPLSYSDLDPNVKRRYTKFLTGMGAAFRWFGLLNVIVFIGCLCVFLFIKNQYEVIIFDDGTEAVCVLEPNTGELKQHVYQ